MKVISNSDSFRPPSRWLAPLVLSLGLAASSLAAPPEYSPRPRGLDWQSRYGYQKSDLIPFELGAGGLRVPVVTAEVQGHPLRLVLDTATRGFATLTPEVIEELGPKQTGTARFLDSAGRNHGAIPRVLVPSLELGPLKLEKVLVTGTGPEAVQGRRIGGLQGTIGWHAFSGGRLTIDYATRTLVFEQRPCR